ncbi:MAG: NifU family protein [Bacilli bacterium]|nr:NifU family protein [Bacilli bacterium]
MNKKIIKTALTENEIIQKICELLDDIRPYLNMEGGDISFVKFEDGYVYVKLLGACSHCMAQDETLNNGILFMLQEEIPDIKGIINVLL